MSARPVTIPLQTDAEGAAERGDFATALQLYRRLAQAEPDEPAWLVRIASTHQSLGQSAEAASALHKAALAYAATGAVSQGLAACRAALRLHPGSKELQELQRSLATTQVHRSSPKSVPPRPAVRNPAESGPLELDDLPPEHLRSTAQSGAYQRERVGIPTRPTRLDLAIPVLGSPPRSSSGQVLAQRPDEDDNLDASDDLFSTSTSTSQPTTLRSPTPSAPSRGGSTRSTPAPQPELCASDRERHLRPGELKEVLMAPLLSGLPEDELALYLSRMRWLDVAPGETIVREGDAADRLFLVLKGDLVAVRGRPARPLARIGEGGFFGEMALVEDMPRAASVVSVTDASLLVLDREVVLELSEQFPSVHERLLSVLRGRLVATLAATSPLFASIPPGDRARVVELFRMRELRPDAVLIQEGQHPPGLFVVLLGHVEIVQHGKVCAALTTGSVVGEIGLLEGHGATATVRCRTGVTALMLAASELHTLVMVHPQILEHLSELATTRKAQLTSE